jgi:hypothetical protein
MKIIFAILSIISSVNAGFDYQVFDPEIKASYNLGTTPKPLTWAIDYSNTLRSSSTVDEYDDIYANGTKVGETSFRYKKFKTTKNALFYSYDIDSSDPLAGTYFGYGYYSDDDGINSFAGGGVGIFSTAISDRNHYRTQPIESTASYKAIIKPDADTGSAWAVDQGYDSNTFITTENDDENDGIVNDKGICATTSDGKYVCTGEQSVIDAWSSKNASVATKSADFVACATNEHLLVLNDGKVHWLSSTGDLPSQFVQNEDFSNILCSNHLFAAVRPGGIMHVVDMGDLGTVRTVTGTGGIVGLSFDGGIMYVSVLSDTTMRIITSLNSGEDYVFNEPLGSIFDIVSTHNSIGFYNGTYFEAYNPGASPASIVINDARRVVSCTHGVIMYLDNGEGFWKVFSHGNTQHIQSLLDSRVVIDWVTTEERGCMLVKMTDEHTGRNYEIPDYGIQSNRTDYVQGHYDDQDSDLILLITSSVTLAFLIIGFTYYCVRIR